MDIADKFLELNSLILALFGVGLFGFMYKIFKLIRDKNQTIRNQKEEKDHMVDERFSALERAMLAMLHNKIYKQCGEHLNDGFINLEDLDDLNYLFSAYEALGGNGTGKAIYKKVIALNNQKKGDKHGQ